MTQQRAKTAEYSTIEDAGQKAFYDAIDNYNDIERKYSDTHLVDRASSEELNDRRLQYIIVQEVEMPSGQENKSRLDKPTKSKRDRKHLSPSMTIKIKTTQAQNLRDIIGMVRTAVDEFRIDFAGRNIYNVQFDGSDIPDVDILDDDSGGRKKFYEAFISFRWEWRGR